jgi:Fe-S-cluster-containing dehydrogenase component
MHTEVGKYPKARISYLPTLCMHCEDSPCMKSCPTKSISQRPDGIVIIDENKCAGSRACISACPYNAITMWEGDKSKAPKTPIEELAMKKHKMGAAQKCTFCVHRIDLGKEKGLTPGVDAEATPACVLTCPTSCRIFGNIEDPSSPVSRYMVEAKQKKRPIFVLRPEAHTKPKVPYVW